MTQEQRDDVYYEAIMIVNELHKSIDYSVYCRLIDLIDVLGLPDETCAAEYPKPAQHEQVSPTTQPCPVCSTPLESRGGYIRVIIGQPDVASGVQGASWYCAECDRAWDYGDLPSNTRQLADTDACDRLRWLLAQAERVVRVDDEDRAAVDRACRLMQECDNGFDRGRG